MIRVGVISDTHGLLRPEALRALAGVSHIVHAGDIGSEEILRELEKIAPVTAVRGNNDKAAWAKRIPETEAVDLGGRTIYVIHDIAELDLDPAAADIAAVVSGHSHKPVVTTKGSVLYVNPGSAGPRRFKLPITVAVIEIDAGGVRAEIKDLEVPSKPRAPGDAGPRAS